MERHGRRRWLEGAIIAALWAANGLLWTSQALLAAGLEGRELGTGAALVMQMGLAAVWALLTPLVLWLGRRFPVGQPRWARHLALHFAASVALAVPLAVLKVLLARLAGQPQALAAPLVERTVATFVSWFDRDLFAYGVVLAVGHALAWVAMLRERERRAAELATQLARVRLASLESQLHPHFLFNALHTIAALVRTNRNAEAVRVVAGLGDLLRRALDQAGGQEVPLAQELEFVDRYLDIERARFGERLDVRRDIDPAALDARVPYLILQPLVENAIRHGIGRRAGAGRVEIGAARRNGHLELVVRDDGPGLPADWDLERSRGLGLRNVRERLAERYGPRQRFAIRNTDGGGVEAAISVPFELSAAEWGGHP